AFSDSVNSSGWQEENIASLNFFLIQNFRKVPMLQFIDVYILIYFLIKTGNKFCARISLDNIPHFGFTKGIVTFFRQFIIWMHLYGQVVISVDKLHQQRKFITKALINFLSSQVSFIFFKQRRKAFSFQFSIFNY